MFIMFYDVDIDPSHPEHTYTNEELQTILDNSIMFRVQVLGGHSFVELNASDRLSWNGMDAIDYLTIDMQRVIGAVWKLSVENGKFRVHIRATSKNYNHYLHFGSARARMIGARDPETHRIIPEKTKIIAFDLECPKKDTT